MVAFAKDYAPDEVRQCGDGAPFMACPQGGCDRVPFGRAQPQIEAPDADAARQRGDAYSPAGGKREERVGSAPKACPKGGPNRVPSGRVGPQNRVGDFFSTTPETRRSDRRSARHPRREKPDRFTKTASGVRYYGFRFYSPGQGRFLNRDPIGELGGLNLYGFAGNNPINFWDFAVSDGLRKTLLTQARRLELLASQRLGELEIEDPAPRRIPGEDV